MAEIHELHVAFLLARMDAEDPTQTSERLGIEPTHAHRKGDPHPTRTNPDLKWRNSIWTLDSRLPANARLDEHLRDILDRLERHAAEITSIRAEGWRAEFRCGLFLDAPNEGTTVAAETLARMVPFGAELGLDIYPGDAPADAPIHDSSAG
jgi:hypothetical protein